MASFFQFVSMLCFSFTNILWKPPLQSLPPSLLIMTRTMLTSTFFLILMLLQSHFLFDGLNQFYKPLSELKFLDVVISIGICLINSLGLLFYNKSMSEAKAGVSIISTSSGIISSVLYALLLYRETITPIQYTKFGLYIVALWFLENLNSNFLKFKISKGLGYALLSKLFWSTWTLYAIAYGKVGVLWFCLILEYSVLLMSVLVFSFSKRLPPLSSFKQEIINNQKWIISLGVLGFCGVLFSTLAMQQQKTIIGYTVFGLLQPVVSLTASYFILSERLTKWQYIGVGIILSTILLK